MNPLTWAANSALLAAYASSHRQLLGITDLGTQQERLLTELVRANADSEFGRSHGFATITSRDEFRQAVPLASWDDYAPAVARIAAGEGKVLTSERVRLLEPTSGSGAATKLVPYTAGLARQFRAGVQPWLHDLYRSYPRLRSGRSYWSITPALTHPEAGGGIPIGFDDDTDYLGPLAARIMGLVLAVPAQAAKADSMDEFRSRTAAALLGAGDLSLVSVWNPSFFTILLEWISAHPELAAKLPKRRREVVRAALRSGDYAAIWPDLSVLSCWADAQAARPAAELAACFPQASLQPKGLLATEAMVSVPITSAGGAVLAARSHLFEFLDDEGIWWAEELRAGGRYQVVVTTAGGLYRYLLGDLVEITGYHGALPRLRFLGRGDQLVDLVGEKLDEVFVAGCLAELGQPGFVVLAGETLPRPHYVLVSEHDPGDGLAGRLDALLRRSFHYDYARKLGQLADIEICVAGSGAGQRYLAHRQARGQRLGDIKPPALLPPGELGWTQWRRHQ